MADSPFYVCIGHGVHGFSGPQDWFSLSNDERHNWGSRLLGYDGQGAVYGIENYPQIWVHDRFPVANPRAVVSIATGAVTQITLSGNHRRDPDSVGECTFAGIGGADAQQINRYWGDAVFRSTNIVEIPLDSSGLGLSATGSALFGGFGSFAIPNGVLPQWTQATDPTSGGSTGSTQWGYPTGLMASWHDKHGPEGMRPRMLGVNGDWRVLGRPAFRVSAVTSGTTTRITLGNGFASTGNPTTGPNVFRDVGKRSKIVLHGFTGPYLSLNGIHEATVVDGDLDALDVFVDTSGASGYAGGANALVHQRWTQNTTGELFDELDSLLADCVSGANQQGDTLLASGAVISIGRRDAILESTPFDQFRGRLNNLSVSSVSTGSFPTRVVLSSPIPGMTSPDVDGVRSQLVARLAGGSSGVVDAVIVSPTEVDLLYTNTEPAGESQVRLEIGEPVLFLQDELPSLVTAIQDKIYERLGTTVEDQASDPAPFVLFQPRVYLEDNQNINGQGRTRAADQRVWGVLTQATALSSDYDRRIEVLDTSDETDFSFGVGTRSFLASSSQIRLADKAFDLMEGLRVRQQSTERGAVPVYVFLGDSLCVGTSNFQTALGNDDPLYNGRSNELRTGEKVWDQRNLEVVDYVTVDTNFLGAGLIVPGPGNTNPRFNPNLNVNGLPSEAVGAEQSLFYELKRRHPDTDVVFFKLGVAGSALRADPFDLVITGVDIQLDEFSSPRIAEITVNNTSSPGGHQRNFLDQTYQVEITALPGISGGLVPGTYTAVSVASNGNNRLRIETTSDITGALSANGSIRVPRWSWMKDAGDVWPELERQRDLMFDWMYRNGLRPDVRGIFCTLGINDARYSSFETFAADHRVFKSDTRSLFATRSEPSPMIPFVQLRPRTNPNYSFATQVSVVQAAIDELGAEDPAMTVINPDSQVESDIEVTRIPFAEDGLHYTYIGYLNLGKLFNNGFDAVDQSCSATPAALSSGPLNGISFTG
ncbi:MAG: hypothetical protein AAF196_17015 [Planctomycetota bacterium]